MSAEHLNCRLELCRADYERVLIEHGIDELGMQALFAGERDRVEMPGEWQGVDVRRSAIHGQGCFAAFAVSAGTFIAPGKANGGQTFVARLINHSPTPNTRLAPIGNDATFVIARRPISAGEELTLDYRQAGNANGWDWAAESSESLKTLRARAVALKHCGWPWSDWAASTDTELARSVAAAFVGLGYLPSISDVLEALQFHGIQGAHPQIKISTHQQGVTNVH